MILLILNPVIFDGFLSSKGNSQNLDNYICNNPTCSSESYNPNDIYYFYSQHDVLVVDDLVIATLLGEVKFLNISSPSAPDQLTIDPKVEDNSSTYANYGNIILFSLWTPPPELNYSIMKIDLAINSTAYTKITQWYFKPYQLHLTNDSLYCFSRSVFDYEFRIYNATNVDDLTFLGNTTLTEEDYESRFYIHNDYVYFISKDYILNVYQINSSYQLTFIDRYTFDFHQLVSVNFYENYLFACDSDALTIYDNINPANLEYVNHFEIPSAYSIRINNDIGYLTAKDSFTTLDLSNIMDIKVLDTYIPGKREVTHMWMIELSRNLAIVVTLEYFYADESGTYGGYLYIFDVSSPNRIKRLYPNRIPLLSFWEVFRILRILLYVFIAILFLTFPLLIIKLNSRKKKHQKKNDQN
ncbi:MAG: hypothetical protein FK730_16685 [Asgard group archaeon]|nr:hypothetical protein [Asgard group archaeon]